MKTPHFNINLQKKYSSLQLDQKSNNLAKGNISRSWGLKRNSSAYPTDRQGGDMKGHMNLKTIGGSVPRNEKVFGWSNRLSTFTLSPPQIIMGGWQEGNASFPDVAIQEEIKASIRTKEDTIGSANTTTEWDMQKEQPIGKARDLSRMIAVNYAVGIKLPVIDTE